MKTLNCRCYSGYPGKEFPRYRMTATNRKTLIIVGDDFPLSPELFLTVIRKFVTDHWFQPRKLSKIERKWSRRTWTTRADCTWLTTQTLLMLINEASAKTPERSAILVLHGCRIPECMAGTEQKCAGFHNETIITCWNECQHSAEEQIGWTRHYDASAVSEQNSWKPAPRKRNVTEKIRGDLTRASVLIFKSGNAARYLTKAYKIRFYEMP